MPGRIIRAATGRQALDHRVKVRLKEEGERIALCAAVHQHPMHCGLEAAIGPPAASPPSCMHGSAPSFRDHACLLTNLTKKVCSGPGVASETPRL